MKSLEKKLRKQTLNLCESYPWYKLIFSEKLGKKVQIAFTDWKNGPFLIKNFYSWSYQMVTSKPVVQGKY